MVVKGASTLGVPMASVGTTSQCPEKNASQSSRHPPPAVNQAKSSAVVMAAMSKKRRAEPGSQQAAYLPPAPISGPDRPRPSSLVGSFCSGCHSFQLHPGWPTLAQRLPCTQQDPIQKDCAIWSQFPPWLKTSGQESVHFP